MIPSHDTLLRMAGDRRARPASFPGAVILFGVLFLMLLPALAASAQEGASAEVQAEVEAATQESAAAESESKESEEAEETAEAAEEESEREAETEEEKDWLVDEKGLYYEIFTLPKVEGTYSRPAEGYARFPGGATYKVVEEDDDTFWLKRFKSDQFNSRRAKPADDSQRPEPEPYSPTVEVPLKRVDRVALSAYDKGLPQRGQWRNGFDLADMNEDGHLDIVFGPARKSSARPVIFLGDGNGNWQRWTDAKFPPAPYDYGDAIAADWNDDGHMDLAFGVHLRGILVLIGDGEGSFELWSEGIDIDQPGTSQPLDAFSSRALGAADWDGDGRLDLLAYGEGPKRARGRAGGIVHTSRGFRVFINQGDGSWRAYQLAPVNRPNFGDDFALLDLDFDGDLDVLTASGQVGSRYVAMHREEEPLVANLSQFEPIRQGGLVDSVEAADLDADGNMDIILTQRYRKDGLWYSGIDVLLHRGDTWELRPIFHLDQREPFRALSTGDVDADGHLDLVTVDDWGVLRIFLGLGNGEFEAEASPESPRPIRGCQGYDVEVANLDGKPGDEIVAAYAGESQGVEALTGTSHPGCPGEGSLKAWSPVPKTSPSPGEDG